MKSSYRPTLLLIYLISILIPTSFGCDLTEIGECLFDAKKSNVYNGNWTDSSCRFLQRTTSSCSPCAEKFVNFISDTLCDGEGVSNTYKLGRHCETYLDVDLLGIREKCVGKHPIELEDSEIGNVCSILVDRIRCEIAGFESSCDVLAGKNFRLAQILKNFIQSQHQFAEMLQICPNLAEDLLQLRKEETVVKEENCRKDSFSQICLAEAAEKLYKRNGKKMTFPERNCIYFPLATKKCHCSQKYMDDWFTVHCTPDFRPLTNHKLIYKCLKFNAIEICFNRCLKQLKRKIMPENLCDQGMKISKCLSREMSRFCEEKVPEIPNKPKLLEDYYNAKFRLKIKYDPKTICSNDLLKVFMADLEKNA